MADKKEPGLADDADPATPRPRDQAETADAVTEAAGPEAGDDDTDAAADRTEGDTVDAEVGAEEPDNPDASPIEAAQEPDRPAGSAAPAAAAAASTATPRGRRGGGFVPAMLGGVVAAVLGFAAARSDLLDPLLPAPWRSVDFGAEIAGLKSTVADQARALADLQAGLAAIDMPDLTPVNAELAALKQALADQRGELTGLGQRQTAQHDMLTRIDERLTALEKRPIEQGVSKEAIAAYERELAKLQQAIADQRSQVELLVGEATAMKAEAARAEAEAQRSAELARQRTTLAQICAALDAGAPYADLLASLSAAGVTVPGALTASAADGVATMAALRASFPDAARAALASARSADPAGDGSGAPS